MFKYFKRPGRTASESSQPGKSDSKRHSLCPSTSSCDEFSYIDEVYDTDGKEYVFQNSSRLSMNLNAIINEKNCLIYFVQFLESKKALSLIKFFLDTENFKTASTSSSNEECCCCTISDEFLHADNISLQSQQSTSETCNDDDDSIDTHKDSNNCVPALKALYDLSMQKSLTDDEKSQIYAEKNKRQLERSTSSASNSKPDDKSQIYADKNKRQLERSASTASSSKYEEKIQAYGDKNTRQLERSVSTSFSIKHTCKTTDAICIYKKYFMPNSEQYVPLPVGILSEISLVLCSDGQSCQTKKIPTNLFEQSQKYVLDKLEHEYLYEFLQSSVYCKYCIELLGSSEITLFDVLYSESALFYFMEYLEQENQRNCLDFWMAAINFRKHYESKSISNFNRNEALSDAMILYEKYFSLQAESPLRISDRIRSIVEEHMCSNDTNSIISRCFDRPLKIIENYLEKEFFPSFLESQLYSKYVHELQSKVNAHKRPEDGSTTQQKMQKISKHRKTMSDCTFKSTKDIRKSFISQHNTLLAMESHTAHSHKSASTNSSPDMHIDSRQFVNPDMLWQRRQANGLKFGRVNALGRYERDFDICPASKNWSLAMGSNTIKSVVRKLANIPEDKIQEEIAWQIAEMIIDDVMSITMNRKLSHKSV